MAVELTKNSIKKLCHGTFIQQPIVQLLGYETISDENSETEYRLVLSDENQFRYGTILRIEEHKFIDGVCCIDHSPRWIILIQKVTILIHRKVFGNPQPLINIEKKNYPMINLNVNNCKYSRVFNNIAELEKNLINVKDLGSQSNGKFNYTLKLTVVKKYPINTYKNCQVLNMKMEDSTGMVRVSAFNALSNSMNEIFMENKIYYICDTILKLNINQFGHELKLQDYSVIIECSDQIKYNVPSIKMYNFNELLAKDPNTFCDLLGVCIKFGDIEVCCNSNTQTEIAKRDITLIDKSLEPITLKVWGEHVVKFDQKFDDNPIVMVKQVVLKQFNGIKHFSTQKNTVLFVNPNTVEAQDLIKWYKEMVNIDN